VLARIHRKPSKSPLSLDTINSSLTSLFTVFVRVCDVILHLTLKLCVNVTNYKHIWYFILRKHWFQRICCTKEFEGIRLLYNLFYIILLRIIFIFYSLLLLQFILIWKETAFLFAIPAVSLGCFIISYCDPMVCVAFAVMWLPVRLLRVQVQSIFTMLFTIYTVNTIRSAVRVRKRRMNVSILKIWNNILLCSSGIICAYTIASLRADLFYL